MESLDDTLGGFLKKLFVGNFNFQNACGKITIEKTGKSNEEIIALLNGLNYYQIIGNHLHVHFGNVDDNDDSYDYGYEAYFHEYAEKQCMEALKYYDENHMEHNPFWNVKPKITLNVTQQPFLTLHQQNVSLLKAIKAWYYCNYATTDVYGFKIVFQNDMLEIEHNNELAYVSITDNNIMFVYYGSNKIRLENARETYGTLDEQELKKLFGIIKDGYGQ